MLLTLDLLVLLIEYLVFLLFDLSPQLSNLLRVIDGLLLSEVFLHFIELLEASIHSFVIFSGVALSNFLELLLELRNLWLLWGFHNDLC